tara:strand:+ start:203 stop:508 length:306 start_codon:yes stop_codon:yes gene_type:complete
MEEQFIRVLFDLKVERLTKEQPLYRIYVNDELFNERTWRWTSTDYLQELLQIKAVPGKYTVRVEKALPSKTRFNIDNMRVELGNARIVENNTIEILKNENT